MLVVDDRWNGKHGIGRLSREIVPRLRGHWRPLASGMSPTSPLDAVNPARLRLGADDTVYSPGFNAGLTRATQILTICDLIHLEVASESSAAKRVYYERLVKPAVKRAGVVLTISEVSKTAITEWLASPDVEVVNASIGLSPSFSLEGPVSKPFDRYFMYVGNLKPHKNFDVLLSALALRPEERLVVVSADREDVMRRANSYGVSERVMAVSNVSDEQLAALYRGSAGLLFPSMLEGFGLPALEAGSAGVPVAYWSGCASIAEIMSGRGVAVDDARSSSMWASAMDALSATDDFEPHDWWRTRYSWATSADVISRTVELRVGRS